MSSSILEGAGSTDTWGKYQNEYLMWRLKHLERRLSQLPYIAVAASTVSLMLGVLIGFATWGL